MLPADWEEYIAQTERTISSRPSDAPKKPPAVKRMTSRRQARAEHQTGNATRAIYQEPNNFNVAITIDPEKTTFTNNLGGSCEPDRPHGKSTQSRS